MSALDLRRGCALHVPDRGSSLYQDKGWVVFGADIVAPSLYRKGWVLEWGIFQQRENAPAERLKCEQCASLARNYDSWRCTKRCIVVVH